jgi:hypothetical protein
MAIPQFEDDDALMNEINMTPFVDVMLVLLCQKSFSLRIAHGITGTISLKVEREQHAQGGDGVRDMALRALDCREGCNPRERQAPRVE